MKKWLGCLQTVSWSSAHATRVSFISSTSEVARQIVTLHRNLQLGSEHLRKPQLVVVESDQAPVAGAGAALAVVVTAMVAEAPAGADMVAVAVVAMAAMAAVEKVAPGVVASAGQAEMVEGRAEGMEAA